VTLVIQEAQLPPFKVVQGHSRSMILVPIESAYTTTGKNGKWRRNYCTARKLRASGGR